MDAALYSLIFFFPVHGLLPSDYLSEFPLRADTFYFINATLIFTFCFKCNFHIFIN